MQVHLAVRLVDAAQVVPIAALVDVILPNLCGSRTEDAGGSLLLLASGPHLRLAGKLIPHLPASRVSHHTAQTAPMEVSSLTSSGLRAPTQDTVCGVARLGMQRERQDAVDALRAAAYGNLRKGRGGGSPAALLPSRRGGGSPAALLLSGLHVARQYVAHGYVHRGGHAEVKEAWGTHISTHYSRAMYGPV